MPTELPDSQQSCQLLEYGRSDDYLMRGYAGSCEICQRFYHYTKWVDARNVTKKAPTNAEHRKESLMTSHIEARTATIEEKITQANNDKILRMRPSCRTPERLSDANGGVGRVDFQRRT